MSPTCRSCYAETLTDEELTRFNSEPATSCIYYCPKHQRVVDQMMASVDWSKMLVIRGGDVA